MYGALRKESKCSSLPSLNNQLIFNRNDEWWQNTKKQGIHKLRGTKMETAN